MRVLVSGATGLVGSALVPFLEGRGHTVGKLVRPPAAPGPEDVVWDPARQRIDARSLEGRDAVVHLAGENIAARRWNAAQKERIRRSRSEGTRFLAQALRALESPPGVLVSASAIGYYGDGGAGTLTEESPRGTGFLPEVCEEWEAASREASPAVARVAQLRFGVILSPEGGALQKMLLPFRMGAGGVLGPGSQYMSWIALDDVVSAVDAVLGNAALSGPVNVVAPQDVTNREFTQALGRVLRRPTVLPLPTFALRLVFGEMGEALFLASARVQPARLLSSGFVFQYPELEPALRHLLTRPS